MRINKCLLCVALIVGLQVVQHGSVFAATIATWNFAADAQPAADNRAPNTLDTGLISAQGLTRGSGVGATGLARSFSADNWVSASKDDSITNGKFYSFELDVQPGSVASYTTLDYKMRRSAAGANAFIWQYKIGGGSFIDIETATSYVTSESDGVFFSDDLSTISDLQNVDENVTFRLVGWGGTASAGTLAIGRFPTGSPADTLILSGTVVAVPEPVMFGFPLFCLALGMFSRTRWQG